MNFEQYIQQWVGIDNQMKVLNDRIKELRDKKNNITEQINTHINTSELSNTSVKISDGQLKFIKVKETQPLTFKYLENCLSEIIKKQKEALRGLISKMLKVKTLRSYSDLEKHFKNFKKVKIN